MYFPGRSQEQGKTITNIVIQGKIISELTYIGLDQHTRTHKNIMTLESEAYGTQNDTKSE